MSSAVEILLYAAALDLYRRFIGAEVPVGGQAYGPVLNDRQTIAMFDMVDWTARPSSLDA